MEDDSDGNWHVGVAAADRTVPSLATNAEVGSLVPGGGHVGSVWIVHPDEHFPPDSLRHHHVCGSSGHLAVPQLV